MAAADDLEVIAEVLNHVAELEALKKSAVPQGVTHKSQALNGHGLLAEAQLLDLFRGQERFVTVDADVTFHDFSSLSANMDGSASVRLQIVPKIRRNDVALFHGLSIGRGHGNRNRLSPCDRVHGAFGIVSRSGSDSDVFFLLRLTIAGAIRPALTVTANAIVYRVRRNAEGEEEKGKYDVHSLSSSYLFPPPAVQPL